MSKNKAVLLAIALTLAAPAGAVAAKTAYETGMATGKKRGYSNPECYATIFAANAVQGPDGKFKGPRGKAAALYKLEIQSKCGISR